VLVLPGKAGDEGGRPVLLEMCEAQKEGSQPSRAREFLLQSIKHMIKTRESYYDEKTGISFVVQYHEFGKEAFKRVSIKTKFDRDDFVFNLSKPEIIKLVGESLTNIGKFVEGLPDRKL
jgi:hypothetical protein